MHLDRRDVIKGLCLTGISGMIPRGIVAGLQPAQDLRETALRPSSLQLLVAGSHQDDAFLDGASNFAHHLGARCSVLRLSQPLYEDPARLNGLLQARKPLIALLRPADGILLRELARSAGLRLSFIGHHRVSGSSAADRHHCTTFAPMADLVCTAPRGFDSGDAWPFRLAESLAGMACGVAHSVAARRTVNRAPAAWPMHQPEELTSLLIQA